MARVLVTRPEPGAARSYATLAARGFSPVSLPLTEVRPLAAGPLPDRFDLAVATSANALRHASREMLAALGQTELLAVGAATAAEARSLGVDHVTEGPGDAERLGEILLVRQPRPREVLYLCGKVRLSGLETRLALAGIKVDPLETYDMADIAYDGPALDAAIGTAALDAVLLYSANAARRFSALAPLIDDRVAGATLLCLSARVAEGLSGKDQKRARIASEPTETALLARLPAA